MSDSADDSSVILAVCPSCSHLYKCTTDSRGDVYVDKGGIRILRSPNIDGDFREEYARYYAYGDDMGWCLWCYLNHCSDNKSNNDFLWEEDVHFAPHIESERREQSSRRRPIHPTPPPGKWYIGFDGRTHVNVLL